MNVDSVREFCLAFPGATEKLQWGDNLCFKVAAKIFAIMNLESVPTTLCFKCSPEDFGELVEIEGVRPAPYVGRYNWAMVDGLSVLDQHDLNRLIEHSYKMVTEKTKLPRLGRKKIAKKKAGAPDRRSRKPTTP